MTEDEKVFIQNQFKSGYQAQGNLDLANPPQGGSGYPSKPPSPTPKNKKI
ncbi:hypothetical protein [Methanosarcina mazei]|nr:hypothetical protein [Methanosarcina mazei]